MSIHQEGVGEADYMIPWVPRISTRLSYIAYREDRRVIYVRFPDGTEWQYEGCSLEDWEAFCSASSLGSHISATLNLFTNRRRTPMACYSCYAVEVANCHCDDHKVEDGVTETKGTS